MKINLEYLQLKYFKIDKKNHNLVSIQEIKGNYFDKLFKRTSEIIQIIKQPSFNNIFNGKLSHCHQILKDEKLQKINKIIDKCYPEARQVLDQFSGIEEYEPNEKVKFGQVKIKRQQRLIFFIFKDTFYPIFFDLNHCIYKEDDKDKKYDDNFNSKKEKWEFNNGERDEIIQKINKGASF